MLEFVDVTVDAEGRLATGCMPRDDRFGSEYPVLEDSDAMEMYDRKDWPDLIKENTSLESYVSQIKNQGREGTCASQATCQAGEIVWNMMLGKSRWIELSPISVYRWIAPGPGTGSTMSGNLRQFSRVGALPVNSDRNRSRLAGTDLTHFGPRTGYYTRFPSGWKDTAAHFRAMEWYDIRSFDGIVCALLNDMPVVYGRAGHAICGVAPVLDKGTYYVRYANSWSPQWGDNGYGHDSERFISRALRSYGAWALRAVTLSDEIFHSLED